MYVPHFLIAALSYSETGHACGLVKPLESATKQLKKVSGFSLPETLETFIFRRAQTRMDVCLWVRIEMMQLLLVVHTTELSSWCRSPTRSCGKVKAGWSSQLGPPNPTSETSHFINDFKFSLQLMSIYFFIWWQKQIGLLLLLCLEKNLFNRVLRFKGLPFWIQLRKFFANIFANRFAWSCWARVDFWFKKCQKSCDTVPLWSPNYIDILQNVKS